MIQENIRPVREQLQGRHFHLHPKQTAYQHYLYMDITFTYVFALTNKMLRAYQNVLFIILIILASGQRSTSCDIKGHAWYSYWSNKCT